MTSPRAEVSNFRNRATGPWLYYYLLNGFETPGGSRVDMAESRRGRPIGAEVVRAYRSRRLKQAVLGALFEEYDRADRRPMGADTHYV